MCFLLLISLFLLLFLLLLLCVFWLLFLKCRWFSSRRSCHSSSSIGSFKCFIARFPFFALWKRDAVVAANHVRAQSLQQSSFRQRRKRG